MKKEAARLSRYRISIHPSSILFILGLIAVWPIVSALAGTHDSRVSFGAKHMTVHQSKTVVGPSVQIDEQGIIFASWVEEDKDTRTILFARSETPGGP
ncbi:MAG TPA: hypothetical protein VFQ06_14385, partial [Nitrospira sp.]|nr:hypothetical protein [Nitrospira sp.]